MKALKNLKFLIRFICFYFIDLTIKAQKNITSKTLLLIRLDAIGDYVLFRNFIGELKTSEKYKGYKITLLGNSIWKSISENLDNQYIDDFIWLDRVKFNENLFYRYKKLKEITSKGYAAIVSPVHSREFFYSDNIVKLVNAKEKIGSTGDLQNIKLWQKKISNRYYTKLVPAKHEIMFEFYRNKDFFENLLHKRISIKKTYIKLEPNKPTFNLPQKYAIIFIGASERNRQWNIESFAKVGNYMKSKYDYEIVLCGAPSDEDKAKEFAQYFKGEYIDLVGKTSLMDLLYVVYRGYIMIANETLAPHFAVALEMKNTFVIYNGIHYGRFTPYPGEIAFNYHVIYHPAIEKDLKSYQERSNGYEFQNQLNINDISSEDVIDKIDSVLSYGSERTL